MIHLKNNTYTFITPTFNRNCGKITYLKELIDKNKIKCSHCRKNSPITDYKKYNYKYYCGPLLCKKCLLKTEKEKMNGIFRKLTIIKEIFIIGQKPNINTERFGYSSHSNGFFNMIDKLDISCFMKKMLKWWYGNISDNTEIAFDQNKQDK